MQSNNICHITVADFYISHISELMQKGRGTVLLDQPIYRDSKVPKSPMLLMLLFTSSSEGRDLGSSCFFPQNDPQDTELLCTAVVSHPLQSGNLHSVLPRERPSTHLTHSNWPTKIQVAVIN